MSMALDYVQYHPQYPVRRNALFGTAALTIDAPKRAINRSKIVVKMIDRSKPAVQVILRPEVSGRSAIASDAATDTVGVRGAAVGTAPKGGTAEETSNDTAVEQARRAASVAAMGTEQALDLPGEEPRRLQAGYLTLVAVWAIALVVTTGYIGMPLTMFLIPVLGSAVSAAIVAVSVVVAGSLSLRLILRAILTERRGSAPRGRHSAVPEARR